MFKKMLEATLSQINRKQKSITRLFPPFPDRVKKVGEKGGARLESMDADTWHFKIHSGTEDSKWYDVTLHFKDWEEVLPAIIKDRRLWTKDKTRIDLRKVAKVFFKKVNVQLQCTCPAAQYWGPNYILSLPRYDAKYGDKETRPPKVRNPKQYGALCKHLQVLFKVLPFYNNTVATWLQKYHHDFLRKLEQEATGQTAKFKQAAKSLQKQQDTTPVNRGRPKKKAAKAARPVRVTAKPAEPAEPERIEPEELEEE